ncbi:UNVERIFIED_CONTAM: hypothetical protein K2H54_047892 [Gekko kuhli]
MGKLNSTKTVPSTPLPRVIPDFFAKLQQDKNSGDFTDDTDKMVTENAGKAQLSIMPPHSSLTSLFTNMERKILENMAPLISPLTEQFADFKLNLHKVSSRSQAGEPPGGQVSELQLCDVFGQ